MSEEEREKKERKKDFENLVKGSLFKEFFTDKITRIEQDFINGLKKSSGEETYRYQGRLDAIDKIKDILTR
jgi:hypothetical protein